MFDAYSPDMLRCRKSGADRLPDLPYGRIIGDYRRVALYGIRYRCERELQFADLQSSPEYGRIWK